MPVVVGLIQLRDAQCILYLAFGKKKKAFKTKRKNFSIL